MKNKIILLLIIFFSAINGFSQTDEKSQLIALNTKVVESYKAGNLEDALKNARLALEMSLKIFGAQHQETAAAYTNLAIIERDKEKYGDSSQSFQNALNIYVALKSLKPEKLAEIYQNLARSQFLDGKTKLAEQNYLQAFELAQQALGKESKDIINYVLALANLYAQTALYEQANQFYLQSLESAVKHYGLTSKEFQIISDMRLCSMNDLDKDRERDFHEKFSALYLRGSGKSGSGNGSEAYQIVNGKAVSLVKPPYPREAREKRLSGQVKIRVEIDENGNVTSAKDVCGRGVLGIASEQAARASKFSQTTINGRPTKVTGVIVYNFAHVEQRIVALPISRPF